MKYVLTRNIHMFSYHRVKERTKESDTSLPDLVLEMLTPTVPILPGSTAEVLWKTSLKSPEAGGVGSVFTWLNPAQI